MSRNTPAKKTAQKKAAQPREVSAPTPMDASVTENLTPVAATNVPRNAYALDAFVAEIELLLPEIAHEVSGADGRNVSFDAQIAMDGAPAGLVAAALAAGLYDRRVQEVNWDDGAKTLMVSIVRNARLQDDRASFSITELYLDEIAQEDPTVPAKVEGDDWDGGSL